MTAAGSGNLTYSWSGNSVTLTDSSATTSQLIIRNGTVGSAGSYQVRVSGTCGNVFTTAAALTVSPRMIPTTTTTTATCFGDINGTVAVTVAGGLDAKQYRLKDQPNYQSTAAFTGLRAGSYTVQVRDGAGCLAETTADVKQPDPVQFRLTNPVAARCAGGTDGAIKADATGGNGGFTYSLNNGPFQTSGDFTGLKANTTYTLTTKDTKSCLATTTAFVGAPDGIRVSTALKPVLCAGGSSGAISVTGAGGTGAYQYQLNQNAQQAANLFENLSAGTYTITVRDANGCQGQVTDVSVSQPAPLKAMAMATQVNCRPNSATITATATGGSGVIQYQLGTAAFGTSPLFTNVGTGRFTVNIKDENGCSATVPVTVTKADTLLIQPNVTAASCCTCANGSVILLASGGTGSKQFSVVGTSSNFQTDNRFTGIVTGNYVFSARDEAGCVASATVNVANASAISLALTNLKNVSCVGGRNGGATVQITGGKRPFIYLWQSQTPVDSIGTGSTVNRLPEGTFSVTVLDSNRCFNTVSASLSALNPLPPKPTVTVSAVGLTSSAQTGVQWYAANADLKTGVAIPNATQPTFVPTNSGPYFVVTTQNGCSSPQSDIFTFVVLAIEPTGTLNLRVIPNPIADQLRVEVDQPGGTVLRVQLLDLLGRAVLDTQTLLLGGKQQLTWPVSHLPTGRYVLRGESGQKQAVLNVLLTR